MPPEKEVVAKFVNVCRPDQMFVVVVPKAKETVFAVFCRGYVNVSPVCLLLKVVQSADVRRPREEPEEKGMFRV